MAEGTGISNDAFSEDDGLPVYQPPFELDELPGFCDRLFAHLLAGEDAEEFVFEGVDVESTQGVRILALGGYDAEQDPSLTSGTPPVEALPAVGYAQLASEWTEGVRRVLRESWGEPLLRTPRLVGAAQDPEGILDVLLISLGIEEAEMWDRGELSCVLMTDWVGEPGLSDLRQILVVLPRELALGGLSALAGEEGSVHELLMHGEQLLELRRRAWMMSALFGAGEVRLRDTAIGPTRCSLQARNGTTTVWTFTDDGRALLLINDPACAFATDAPQQFFDDHLSDDGAEADEAALTGARLILITRMLDGVPEDLRALIPARAEDARGQTAEHALAFRVLGDRPVPVISGAAWFDGHEWCVSSSMLEIGHRNAFGMDDFGFADAVRRPYLLGGSFTVDDFAAPASERRAMTEQAFADCPYPEQARPSDADRLGYAVPSGADHPELVQQIEQAAEAWWEQSPSDMPWGDRTFFVGNGVLRGDDGRVLTRALGTAEPWTVDALQAWTDALIETMEARWGPARELRAVDERTGAGRRTPLARVMRGTGLLRAPMWWVNGHAVALLAGMPDPEVDDHPLVIVAMSRADAVLDIMRGTKWWEVRRRARAISDLGATASSLPAPHPIEWDGPPLEGSSLVPDAVRGALRTEKHVWVWHQAHDGRGLLMSYPVDAAAGAAVRPFAEQAALFAGVPDDLLSLVVDLDPGGLYPVVARAADASATEGDRLARAGSLPAVQAVFWRDDVDWRASEGMLRMVRAAGIADAAGTGLTVADPLATLYSQSIGVPQLQWALAAGDGMGPGTIAQAQFSTLVFDRPVELEEAEQAFERLGSVHELALTGSLNDLLDAISGSPGYRFLLDGALSNPDPRHRREIALWLLEQKSDASAQDIDASIQLSFLTPINVLFENPTLGAGDAPVLRQLLRAGAKPGAGLAGATIGGDPLAQLANRDLDDSESRPLYDALRAATTEP